jgi:hypothetical protein
MDYNKLLEDLRTFLDSEEGKKSMERFAETVERDNQFRNRWVERFKKYSEGRLDEVLEKIIDKYDSDKYVNSEYSKGYEPREELLWVAFNYATENCEVCEDQKYINVFTGCAYYIGSYVIQIMHGQGSVIKIEKTC